MTVKISIGAHPPWKLWEAAEAIQTGARGPRRTSYLQANLRFPPLRHFPLSFCHPSIGRAFNLKKVKFHLSAERVEAPAFRLFDWEFNGTIVQVEADPIRPARTGGKTEVIAQRSGNSARPAAIKRLLCVRLR